MTRNLPRTVRRSERIAVHTPVSLLLPGRDEKVEHPADMLDISQLGMRIKTDVPLTPGQTVIVALEYAEPYRVVWVREARSKQEREVGLEILRSLST